MTDRPLTMALLGRLVEDAVFIKTKRRPLGLEKRKQVNHLQKIRAHPDFRSNTETAISFGFHRHITTDAGGLLLR